MAKSPDAFRTISEVSEWLDTPAHVLRFWESRFTQVKPVKRAGGRRYYRPADMLLLGGIKHLLHGEGVTIRGVQKILREQGIKHVSGLSVELDETPDSAPKTSPKTDEIIDVVAEKSTTDAGAKVIPLRSEPVEKPADEPVKTAVAEPAKPIQETPAAPAIDEVLSDTPTKGRTAELTPEDLMADPADFGESLFEEDDDDDETDAELGADFAPSDADIDDDQAAQDDRNFFAQNDADGTAEETAMSLPGFVTGAKKNRMDILAQAASVDQTTDSPDVTETTTKMALRDDADQEKFQQLYGRLKNLRDRVAGHD